MSLLLWAAAVSQPVPTTPAPRSAEELTQPNVDFDCLVLDRRKEARTVSFHLSGSRGYPVKEQWRFAATEPTFSVVKDDTGFFAAGDSLYDNTAFEKFTGNWVGRTIGRFDKNGASYVGVHFFDAHNGAIAVVLERRTQPMMSAAPDFAFAGMCKVVEAQQTPLAKSPTTKALEK